MMFTMFYGCPLACWRGSGIGGLGIVDKVVSSLCKVEGSSICGREIVILGTIVYVTPTVMINGTDRFWLLIIPHEYG